MKKALSVIISIFLLATSVSTGLLAEEPTDSLMSSKEVTVESLTSQAMSIVTEALPFGFDVVSVGRDTVTVQFVSEGKITTPPYVGVKGTRDIAEKASDLQYVLEYDKEYSFVYTVMDGDAEVVYNSFITVQQNGTPEVVFGQVVRNIVNSASARATGTVYESESNNTMATADTTQDDYDSIGALTSTSDVDYWKVTFLEAGRVNFWLGNIPAGCNYDLSVFNSAGVEIGYSMSAGQTAELITLDVSAGTYYIKITSYSGFSSSTYLCRAKWYAPEPEEPTLTFVLYNSATNSIYNGSATIEVCGHYDNTSTTARTISGLSGEDVGYNIRVAGFHTYVGANLIDSGQSQTIYAYLVPVGNAVSSAGFTNPLAPNTYDYRSRFGWRSWPEGTYIYFDNHLGADFGANPETPILSVCDVSSAEFYTGVDPSMGNFVRVTDVESGRTITYMHMNNPSGESYVTSVPQGGEIGRVGNTGNSHGYHLHIQIEVTNTGNYHDPLLYFDMGND